MDDLLDVSRINQGKLELPKPRIDLAVALTSAVECSRPLIEEMGHDLELILPQGPVVVDADPTGLAQVFLNLLNNAAKYSDRSGRIRLSAEEVVGIGAGRGHRDHRRAVAPYLRDVCAGEFRAGPVAQRTRPRAVAGGPVEGDEK